MISPTAAYRHGVSFHYWTLAEYLSYFILQQNCFIPCSYFFSFCFCLLSNRVNAAVDVLSTTNAVVNVHRIIRLTNHYYIITIYRRRVHIIIACCDVTLRNLDDYTMLWYYYFPSHRTRCNIIIYINDIREARGTRSHGYISRIFRVTRHMNKTTTIITQNIKMMNIIIIIIIIRSRGRVCASGPDVHVTDGVEVSESLISNIL